MQCCRDSLEALHSNLEDTPSYHIPKTPPLIIIAYPDLPAAEFQRSGEEFLAAERQSGDLQSFLHAVHVFHAAVAAP